MYKVKKFFIWQFVVPLLLVMSIIAVSFYIYSSSQSYSIQNSQSYRFVSSNLTPSYTGIITRETKFESEDQDFRVIVLNEYFRKYSSPLYGYGDEFVKACDKYNAPKDCTTVAAIAYVETGLCTLDLSDAQKNCWGFGGSAENRIWFKSYPEAIDFVTMRLAKSYGSYYMQNPVAMQFTYCGANCVNWGNAVQQQRFAINKLSISLGYNPLIK